MDVIDLADEKIGVLDLVASGRDLFAIVFQMPDKIGRLRLLIENQVIDLVDVHFNSTVVLELLDRGHQLPAPLGLLFVFQAFLLSQCLFLSFEFEELWFAYFNPCMRCK